MRRSSVSLPTKHLAHDPHEKPDRYDNGDRDSTLIMKMQSAWASQSQRARYIKTGAIIFVVFLLFYYFSPSGVDIYHEGRLAREVETGVLRAVADHFQLHQTKRLKARRRPTRRTAPTSAPSPSPRTSPLCSTSP
jgi:hypothetical protein